VVGFLQPVISSATSQLLFFLDSPEIGPNALIGISSAFTTGPTAASSNPTVHPAITSVTSSSSSSFLPANATVTASTSSGGGPDTGAIVGGVLGGIAVIAVAVVGAVYRFRQRVKASPAAFVVGDAPQPRNQARNPLSDDGTRVSFSTHEAPIPSMRDHVMCFRAFVAFVLAHVIFSCTLSLRTQTNQRRFRRPKKLRIL